MVRAEIWSTPTGRLHRLSRRASSYLGVLEDRIRGGVSALTAPSPTPGGGPQFAVSGYHAAYDELEAIVFHPAVLAAIEREPPAPFDTGTLSEPRMPISALPTGRPRRAEVRIVDLVPFGMELDVLELRLAQLYDLVDAFIVVESNRGYGGIAKPLVLQRNLARLARFAPKLHPLVIDAAAPSGRRPALRQGTDWSGEMAFRSAMWHAARPALTSRTETIVIASDCDEIPPRHLLHWIRRHDVPLPLRVRVPTLRFNLGWRDPRVHADIVVVASAQFPDIDADPGRLRTWPAPTVGVRGGVHLTSFLDPLALIAKFAITTDWEAAIVRYLRNAHDETATMVARGLWFGRPMRRYVPEVDSRGLIPEALRLHRARFAPLWPQARS